jgi:hypothetical protein
MSLIVNANEYDYGSIEFEVNGVPYQGTKSINYKEGVEIGKTFGTARHVRGTTGGRSESSGDLEMFRTDWNRLLVQVGPGLGLVRVQIAVAYAEPGLPVAIDTLIGCRIIDLDSANSEGVDASIVKVGLHISRILWNGQTLVIPRGLGGI